MRMLERLILFTNITSSDGENKENYDKASIQVLVTRDAKEGEAIPNHQVFDADDKEETVLKTISTMPFSVGITVLIFLLILYILFQLKTNHPNKKKKVMNALRVILVLLLALMILFFIGHKRRDINNDGETTYEDTQEIIKYLIEMEGTPSPEEETKGQVAALLPSKKNNSNKNNSNNKNKYDVNNDGKVDINDAGASAEHVTEEVHYTVKLSEKGNSYYLEKGSITLEFYASVNPKETIKEVKVDGTYYPVEQEGEYYRVLLEETTAGVHTFKLTDVRLSNTREVHTNLSITKEILKDIPGFTNVNIHEKEKNIEFELVDQDHAFINGAAYIYDGETKIAEEEVREITTIQFDLTTDKMYRIVVLGNYDLDSDPNNAANLYEDKELFVHTFLVGGNYNFTFSNLLLTDTIEHQELPKLTFTSTNTKATSVEKVNLTVDGHEKDYIISKMDHNDYEVELTDANLTIGKHTVQINRFVMKTLKQFVNEQDFILPEMTYEVLKDAPKVENIKLQEHSYTETRKNDKNEDVEVVIKGVNVQFDLKDQDNAVSNMTIALVDSTNKIVATKEFSKEEYNTYAHTKEPIFLQYADKNSSNNNYGAFTVEFLADYTLGDRHNFTNKSIGKQDFYPNTGVKITKIDFVDQDGKAITDENKKAQAKYATKGQKKYRIQFEVETEGINSYSRMSGVTINGLNYTLEGGAKAIPDETDPDNKKLKFQYISNTAFTVPNEAGIVDVKANRIQFENNGYYVKQNDYYAIPEKSIQFEVLKDIPTIKNLEVQEENPLAKTVTFTFTVTSEDGAFKSGKVQLGNETIEITNEELEHKSVTFHNVEPNQMYDLLFEATYDLDSNLLDKERNLNEKIDDKIYQVKYGMFDNSVYETIAIKNGSAISEDGDIYFEKMEPIKLFFTIDDLPENLNLIPQRVLVDGKEYELIKTKEGYTILLDGYTTFGEKELTITNIIFNNGKNVTLNTPYRIRPVVLKDRVKIENYSYEIGEKDLVIKFDTLDYDSSLIAKAKVTVQDEEGTILYTGKCFTLLYFNYR